MNLWYRSKATPAPGIALVSAQAPAATAAAIEELRQRSLAALADCTRPQDERVRGQLQLWQARCEIYQAIARQHCEAEAARRLNGLLPAFEGLMPERALKRL